MTEKEFLAVAFTLEKFRPYLLGSKTTIFMDHSALKHLMIKKEAKAWLIRWILLLQEFDLEIRDKKSVENVVADQLSRIPNVPIEQTPINEDFPDEHILAIFKESWYVDIVNYLVTGQLPTEWTKTGIASLPKFDTSSGKNRISSSIVLIKSFDDIYRRKDRGACSISAMSLHAENTSVSAEPQRKFCKVGFTGPLCSKTPFIFVSHVQTVKRLERFRGETWCP